MIEKYFIRLAITLFFSRSYLNGHPGLNRAACCGDITLAFTYRPSFDDDEETSVKTKVLTSENIDKVKQMFFQMIIW